MNNISYFMNQNMCFSCNEKLQNGRICNCIYNCKYFNIYGSDPSVSMSFTLNGMRCFFIFKDNKGIQLVIFNKQETYIFRIDDITVEEIIEQIETCMVFE